MSTEENLESWITGETERQSRRERMIPSTTDRIRGEHPTRTLQAMENISRFMGLHPEIPMVIGGGMTQNEITLSFESGVDLPSPFLPLDDGEDQPETWAIACADTVDLQTGTSYGRQMQALTAFGHLSEGGEVRRILTSTVGTKILGMAGREPFKRSLMIGQIMEQATEPWGADHQLWLVGFGDLGDQLIQYLSPFHSAEAFHQAGTLSEITEADLGQDQATIYVMGSSKDTLAQFLAINTGNVGIITDSVVDDSCLYICETDGPAAELETGYQGVGVQRFMPNRIEDDDPRFVAMTEAGKLQQQEAEPEIDISPEDFFRAEQADHSEAGSTATPAPAADDELAQEPQSDPTQQQSAPAEEDTAPAFTDQDLEDFLRSAVQEAQPQQTEASAEPEAEADQPVISEEPFVPTHELALLGKPRVITAGGEVTGQAAEAVAFVVLNGGSVTPTEISAALWPGDSTEGNTARTRRSRLVKKINLSDTETVVVDDSWTVTGLATDLEEVLSMLADPKISDTALVGVAESIDNPLDGCEAWAEGQRENMRTDLMRALESVDFATVSRSEEATVAVDAARARLQ